MIKREVFEKLDAHPATKPFANDIGLDPSLNQYMKTYFDTAVREGRYYSEDWTFCENWRDLGGQVWVDKRVLLRHTGTYTFDAATQDKLYHDLHALVLSRQTPTQPIAPAQPMHNVDPAVLTSDPASEVIAENYSKAPE